MDGVSKHAFLRPAWQGLWAAGGRRAGSSHGWAGGWEGGRGRQTGGQAALHSQAKAQNGAAAPVAMETELNNEQPEMQHGCLALWPHSHQALTPTHRSSYTHTHVCKHSYMQGHAHVCTHCTQGCRKEKETEKQDKDRRVHREGKSLRWGAKEFTVSGL